MKQADDECDSGDTAVVKSLRVLALLVVALATAGGASAQTPVVPAAPTTLNVIAFAGGWNLPLWAAQRQGFFEQQGLAIQLSFTPNSGALIGGLMSGRFDLLDTGYRPAGRAFPGLETIG